MRPGQNKRMRGRNNNNNSNNNRKGPNPLTRSYESNGPDVKIRGTAHHVAEKYLQLARDAQTSGDPVAAESYLQHAEHYFRLIAAAQQAQMGSMRPADEQDTEETDEEEANALPDRFASPLERPQPTFNQPQPYADRPYSGERPNGERPGGFNGERQPYGERSAYGNGERPAYGSERQDRNGYEGRRNDRMGRQRSYRDQDGRNEQRGQDYRGGQDRAAPDRQPDAGRNPDYRDQGRSYNGQPRDRGRDIAAEDRPMMEAAGRQPEVASAREPEPIPRQPDAVVADQPGLPAFITAPVRVATGPQVEAPQEVPVGGSDAPQDQVAEEAPRFPPRRRRRPRTVVQDGTETVTDVPVTND